MIKLFTRIIIFFTILFCHSHTIMAQLGEWTYMNGSTVGNSTGSFGIQGVSSSTNHPPALYEAAHWVDNQGNLWLFGGVTLTGSEQWNDLWKYDPLINEWTWVKGPGTQGQSGSYGTLGVSSPSNHPGSRAWGLLSWKDINGDFWLYGGYGSDAFGGIGPLGDLWKYALATNEWTWMNGSNINYTTPVLGSYQTFSSATYPGSINECTASWRDATGNLWFFGGNGYNTVFEYDVSINQWAWMNGSGNYGVAPVYGTKGVFNATNQPGSRDAYCTWVDNNNKFWLFGGNGGGNLADLWQFDPDIKQWAWMSGSTFIDYTGNAGTLCDTSVTYTPSARRENTMVWVDSCDNAWMFGGYHDYGGGSFVNDMWVVSTSLLSWAWIDGSFNNNLSPVFGIQGVSSPTNDPGGRMGCPYWKDLDGNFWVYGGWGLNSNIYADLWRYKPDLSCTGFNICNAVSVSGFSASSQDLCKKFCIDFTDQSLGNPTSWQWIFAGGSPSTSTDQNPTNICYNNPGTYDVTLITGNTFGNDTLTLPNYITVYGTPPIPVITQNGYVLTSTPAFSYQWQFNNADIPGATNQSYAVTQTGYYSIFIKDQNGCAASATQYVLITGLENVLSDMNVLVYPNPSDGNFIVELSNCLIADHVTIEIVNMVGQVVYSSENKIQSTTFKNEIHLCRDAMHCVSTGIYFIEIRSGNLFSRQKIMVGK